MNKEELYKKEEKIYKEMLKYYNTLPEATEESKQKNREWLAEIANLEIEYYEDAFNIVQTPNNTWQINLKFEKSDLHSRFEHNWDGTIIDIIVNENNFRLFNKFSKDTVLDCLEMLHGFLHEIEHLRQFIAARQGISSYSALTYAKEQILISKYPKFYEKNHDIFFFEEEANLNAAYHLYKVTGKNITLLTNGSSHYNIGAFEHQRNNFINYIFDKFIKKDDNISEYFSIFPILYKEYNSFLERRSGLKFIKDMQQEKENIKNNSELDYQTKDDMIVDCTYMYYELLYKTLQNSNDREILELSNKYNNDYDIPLYQVIKNFYDYYQLKENQFVSSFLSFKDDEVKQREINNRDEYYNTKIDFFNNLAEKVKQSKNIEEFER